MGRRTCCAAATLALGLTLAHASLVHAQTEAFALAGAGGWINPNRSGGLLSAAAGLEGLFGNRTSAGAEIGVMAGQDGQGLLNIAGNARVRLGNLDPTRRTTPFLTGGYSYLLFFEAFDHAFHAGVGLDHRLSARRALRVEFRDIVRPRRTFPSHYWAIRVGLTFR